MKRLKLLPWVAILSLNSGLAVAQTFTMLVNFGAQTYAIGRYPSSQLVQAGDGTLYGATASSLVFKLQPEGFGFSVITTRSQVSAHRCRTNG